MGADKRRRQTVAAIAASALLTLGWVWFSADFFRNAPREDLTAEIIHREAELPEISEENKGKTEESRQDDSEPDKDSSMEESSREDSSAADSTASESSQADSSLTAAAEITESHAESITETVPTEESSSSGTGNDDTEAVSSKADDSSSPVTAQTQPNAGTPEKSERSGKEADREYFTTSIKDGETVHDSIYFFTVTQLIDELELIRCDVELNGTVQTGYAGKCRLREGRNTIRVSCTYKDSENRVYRAYRDHTVYLESRDHPITTDLTDCTVYERELTFTAACEDGLEVSLNGETVTGEGEYTVSLREGENMIRLCSGRQEVDISVNYIPITAPDVITDLTDCTVYEDSIEFSAQAVGGRSPKLTVQINVKTLRGNGTYTAPLKEGANMIRLLAKDGSDTCEKIFTVTCLPDGDSEKLPVIESISLTDNMTVKGSAYTLTMRAADCDGTRIYSGHIEVACGGNAVEKKWEDASVTGYILTLRSGENSVYIRLTDTIGRQSEFFYTIYCEGAGAGEETGRISITVKADCIGLGVLCENDSYPVLEGETGFDTIVRFLEDNGFEVDSRGSDSSKYLMQISMPGRFAGAAVTEEAKAYLEGAGISLNDTRSDDTLGEFDYTAGSGWIYSRGGKRPTYAMSAAVFGDGESIELDFSLDLGNDIGGEDQ